VDPITVGVGVLSKLITLGLKGAGASDGNFDEKDVEALRTLLDTGAALSGLRKQSAPSAAALHLAIVARAFGRAVARHQEFHGKLLLTGGLRRWLSRSDKEREQEIELRVRLAALRVRQLGDSPHTEVAYVDQLVGSPLGTPYYRALWQAFSDPALTNEDLNEEPPLVMSATARREFERYFLLAHLEGAASPSAQSLDAYLGGLESYRTKVIQELLVADLATWGERHVFGNVPRERWDESEAIPFLPLDTFYVEPSGELLDIHGQASKKAPLLDLLEELVSVEAPEKVVVVIADFGSGKSLSARMLARRWAARFLEVPTPSLDLPLPVYVRCAEDFPHDKVDLPSTLQMAWKRQARSFSLSLADDDGALCWPLALQRLVCLLDGLDEVSLGEQHAKNLFQRLGAKTTRTQRFVIFSRPGAIPPQRELGENVVLVRVQPFEDAQIETWLAAWNALPRGHSEPSPEITLEAFEAQGLRELARTPILLFMVAFTWKVRTNEAEAPSLAEIYEHFFQQIATGKAETGNQEKHAPIAKASEALLAELQSSGALDSMAKLPDAMLWLMGRVAWEAHCLEQQNPSQQLTRRHLENLVHNLKIPTDSINSILFGLILALQTDFHAGADHVILFGHQSFREFLVGRHWAIQLLQLARGNALEWHEPTAKLMGGRLLADEDKSFDFLMQIVNAATSLNKTPFSWSDAERSTLATWAQHTFNSEEQSFANYRGGISSTISALRLDQRALLREAALAIGSTTQGSPGIRIKDELTLRSMLAWFWMGSISPRIIAARAIASNAQLEEANLTYANLLEADLSRANLSRANLSRANLSRANLSRAEMSQIQLSSAVLSHCDLREANLFAASLFRADLTGSNISSADLSHAYISSATLRTANLSSANLSAANLNEANLSRANLNNANLNNANLNSADLRGADLRGADLRGADLRGADLRGGADLSGAKLSHAQLYSADRDTQLVDLVGFTTGPVIFDETTKWPVDFVSTTIIRRS
jgi:uncharacterized protein YjbI with pentapeptide repeats